MLKQLSDEASMYLNVKKVDMEIIKKASQLLSIGHTTFVRQAAIEKARDTIKRFS